jgi:hypothetical protein
MTTEQPVTNLNDLSPENWRNVATLCTAVGVLATDEQIAEVLARAERPEDLSRGEADAVLCSLRIDPDRLLGRSFLDLPGERKLAGTLVGLRLAQGFDAEDFAAMRALRAA